MRSWCLAMVIFAITAATSAYAQTTEGLFSIQQGPTRPFPLGLLESPASKNAGVITAGPLYTTFAGTGLPCYGCAVPYGGSTPAPYTYGSDEPYGTLGTQTEIEYVLHVADTSCPASTAPSGSNIAFEIQVSQGGKVIDHASAKVNIAMGYITYVVFDRPRPANAVTGYAVLQGMTTCMTSNPKVRSMASTPLYFG